MSMCAAHPEVESVGACQECGKETCAECRVELSGSGYCQGCVEQARQNLPQAVADLGRNVNYLGAVALGLVAAVVGAYIWDRVAVWFSLNIGLIAIAIGWGVGLGVIVGSGGKRGLGLQILSLLITGFGIALGELLTLHDMILLEESAEAVAAVQQLGSWPIAIALFPTQIMETGFMGWAIYAFGLWQAWMMPKLPTVGGSSEPERGAGA